MARVYPAKLKASNVEASNTWLTQSFEGTRSESAPAADQLVLARGVLDRKARKRTALLVREADTPISDTVESMLQMLRMGRVSITDIEATHRSEQDRLSSLRAMNGAKSEIERLEASVAVRQEVLDLARRDTLMSVMSPVHSSMAR